MSFFSLPLQAAIATAEQHSRACRQALSRLLVVCWPSALNTAVCAGQLYTPSSPSLLPGMAMNSEHARFKLSFLRIQANPKLMFLVLRPDWALQRPLRLAAEPHRFAQFNIITQTCQPGFQIHVLVERNQSRSVVSELFKPHGYEPDQAPLSMGISGKNTLGGKCLWAGTSQTLGEVPDGSVLKGFEAIPNFWPRG